MVLGLDPFLLCVLIPIKTKYSNVEADKANILSSGGFIWSAYFPSKNKSGVYMFNGKRYVGSSRDIRDRMYDYLSIKSLERYICRALKKHDYSNFSLEIFEYCSLDKSLER
jgi:hypothetical protein